MSRGPSRCLCRTRLAAFHLKQYDIDLFARGKFENNAFADAA
jgi:hypothetical protein